jgi:predicted  nucleic acid-binding Zn-ribbon protein
MAAKEKMPPAQPSATPIKNLAKAIADGSGWIRSITELNEAIQPFVNEEIALDKVKQVHDDMVKRKEVLEQEIMLRENHLATVNERITLADDARKAQIDADFQAYKGSLDSKGRELQAELAKLQSQIDEAKAGIDDKRRTSQELAEEIANQRRTLDQVKADLEAVIKGVRVS